MKNTAGPTIAFRSFEELARLIAGAQRNRTPSTFDLAQLVGHAYVSRTSAGLVCIVLLLRDTPGESADVHRGITLALHQAATIRVSRRSFKSGIAVIECRADEYFRNFCVLAADICESIEIDSSSLTTGRQVEDFVANWADVFVRPSALSREAALGLWGELHILAEMPNVDRALEAWHGPEAGTFDFAARGVSLEVKTSRSFHEHEFNLLQVSPPARGGEAVVASLRVLDDPASGLTLDDQVRRVLSQTTSGLLMRKKLARLGYTEGALRDRVSLRKLIFLPCVCVPQPHRIDPGVRSVRFVADVSQARSLPARQVKAVLRRICGLGA